MNRILNFMPFILFLFVSSVSPCKTIHVPNDFLTIQQGIDNADNGDTVLVAPGIYTGAGNKNLDFREKSISLVSESGAKNTVIDCENDGRGIYFTGDGSNEALFKGFTVRNGYAADFGAGIYCQGSALNVEDCIFRKNKSLDSGGGIYCLSANPLISNCIFSENWSKNGGGIFCSHSNPFIETCIFINNTSRLDGAGICCDYASPEINNCVISQNIGEAISIFYYSPKISRCIVSKNTAYGIVCGNSSPEISSCTITENGNKGFYCLYSSPIIKNSIIWNNQTEIISESSILSINYSDVSGGWIGTGNIDKDPLFTNPQNGDYSLQKESPCIDKGDHSSPVPYGGGCRIDMGAIEFDKGFNCQRAGR